MRKSTLLIFLIVIFGFSFLPGSDKIPDNFMRIKLQWFPQSQFAGYIMALEKGFYEDEGLDVELIFSDGSDSPLEIMMAGGAEICTAWLSEAIPKKDKGFPIVNIAQILQKSSLMLVAKKNSNINEPSDMDGKKVGFWKGDFSIQPRAFFRKNNVDYIEIPQSYNIHGFLADAWDITSAMYYNEYHKIIQAGINDDELVTFFFSDYDLNFPEDGLYCSESYFYNNMKNLVKFVTASMKGWKYAFENEHESLEMIMNYCDQYHLQTNYTHQKWMLNAMNESVKYNAGPGMSDWGVLAREDYFRVAEELKLQGLINEIPKYVLFFRGLNAYAKH